MTKALATVAALQLVERGELALDAEVASILPEWGDLQVLEGFDGDTPRLRPPAGQATIRQLMTHTAGHGYWFDNPDLVRYHEVSGVPTVFEGKAISLTAPLVADPGTRWEYGINTDWLGKVVEAVSGQRLDAYLADNVFTPLGMSETTFTPRDDQRGRTMAIHARTPDGGLAATDIDLPAEPEWMAGGHGAYSTAGDYARFMAALLSGGGPILKPETVDLAFSDHLDGIALPEVIVSAAPEYSNDVPAAPFPQTWGLGFCLTLVDVPEMRRAGTGNWAGLFNCYYWIDRRAGVAAALLTQVLPFFDQQIVDTLVAFEQAVYADVVAPT